MSFFKNFSLRWYDFNSYKSEEQKLITNFLHNVSVSIDPDDVNSQTFSYYINDGDTLYSVSNEQYKHPDYWWIIALLNNQFLSRNTWPKTQSQFEKWIDKKYNTIQPREIIKFYEKESGTPTTLESIRFFHQLDNDRWTDLEIIQHFNLMAISIYEWESRENEKKKYIRLPKVKYIQEIERLFKDKMTALARSYRD